MWREKRTKDKALGCFDIKRLKQEKRDEQMERGNQGIMREPHECGLLEAKGRVVYFNKGS